MGGGRDRDAAGEATERVQMEKRMAPLTTKLVSLLSGHLEYVLFPT